ncbi:signal peptidase I [Arthrobacter bambusae]|uniref:signal peptidase I n=1 Tax=Arthrobacter bambusae TaxID=1338426 RepID=UPI00277EEA56|nr:signal peptidase I [Arthrobacter bambusae]MDQ0031290.1 signal peptidase I [Arthrobacter bambusae]MDQ0099420.1 signal peptidase I [Arthrobacter bambusae]
MPETTPGKPERHDDDARLLDGPSASATDVTADDAYPARGSATGPTAAQPEEPASPRRAARRDSELDPDEGDRPETAGKTHGSPFLSWLREIGTVVVIAIVLSFLIKTFLFRAFFIPSESMVPTLDVDDRIFVNLLVPQPFALERGDVVVFKDSQGWLPPTQKKADGPFKWFQDGLVFVGLLPDETNQHLVKRVIGLPGDRVSCCDSSARVSVNGTVLNEGYINPAQVPIAKSFDVVVPAGKIWVMGDNRNNSADSREHQSVNGGFIDISDVEGRATVIAWPISRWQILDNHAEVFRNVPAPSPQNTATPTAPAGK